MTKSDFSGPNTNALNTTGAIPLQTANRQEKVSLQTILERKFTATQFLKYVLVTALLLAILTAGINATIDIYGLFLPVRGKALPIYNNERISKYLLSYRYIPQNFDRVIIGTSLSANLDVASYNNKSNEKIYNASIMGANISEIKPVAENLVNGGVKSMIICFSPYMTKNSGSKEVTLNQKLYFGALGSKNLYETYAVALLRYSQLLPHKFPKNQVDQYGVNHYESFFQVSNVEEKIAKVIDENKNERLTIDPKALQELSDLIHLLKEKNIDFVGYFHPVPADILASKRDDYKTFEMTVRNLVGDDSKLINFNSPEYEWFTSDYNNYIDHGHLSEQGQKRIFSILTTKR